MKHIYIECNAGVLSLYVRVLIVPLRGQMWQMVHFNSLLGCGTITEKCYTNVWHPPCFIMLNRNAFQDLLLTKKKSFCIMLTDLILFRLQDLPQRLGVLHIMMMCCWAHSRA